MKAIKIIFYVCILFVIMSCAHEQINVQFCENQKCTVLTEADSKEAVFQKLTAMIKANLNKKIPLIVSSEKGGKTDKDLFFPVRWTMDIYHYEFLPRIHSLTFTDVLYIDRETRVIKVMAQADVSYPAFSTAYSGSYPAFSSTVQMPCSLTVRSSKEIIFQARTKLAPFYLNLEGLIDHINVDNLFLGSAFEISIFTGRINASQKGYLHLSFQDAEQKTNEALADTKVLPIKTDTSKPELAYKVAVADTSEKDIFYGGERVSIRVEVENKGKGIARDVQVLLSGSKSLISYIGDRRFIGDIQSGDKGIAEFGTFLPVNIQTEIASMHVEIVEGNGFSPKEKKSFQIAMRPAKASKESVEVITAAHPQLAYTAQLKGQDNKKVLEGGKGISLRVEIENTGKGTANDVSIELSGQKEIIDTLGNKARIGNIEPKQKKVHVFKGILPADMPSTTAILRVRINEINGYSPAGKNFQVALKAAETATEQTEILSEIDVDDIPPRIKGFKNKDNYAVVIGISTYRDKSIPKVKYAGRDAETMAKYLEHLAGIPKENILIKTDADVTKSDLEEFFEKWLPRRVTSDSLVYIFYAGHGTPDPAGKDAYIVPYEGNPDSPGMLYPLTKMYGELSKLPAKQVIVMLDSCFSGAKGRGVLSEGARPLFMSLENHVLTGNKVVVIAGAKGNQISSDYDKVKHGLFTYYLLRGIRGEADSNGTGFVDVGDLYEYVKQNVTRKAALEFNRDQTPDLLPDKAAGSVLSLPVARTK
jgi:hypothetical protein